jgi:hypothetical protein
MKDPTARELIVELRGGVPLKCDFCNKETTEENLHPEEAGMWACITCMDRWTRDDACISKGFKKGQEVGYQKALKEIEGILVEHKVTCTRCEYALSYISKRRAVK